MPKSAEGWVKIDSITGGTHHYHKGFPACSWNARQQMDEQGRCLACAQAVQKLTSAKPKPQQPAMHE